MIINANIELHVHPFLENNSIAQVMYAMQKQDIQVLALEILDKNIFPKVLFQTQNFYKKSNLPYAVYDKNGLRLHNNTFILNAREYNTLENLHLLTVGYAMSDATPKTEIRKIIDNSLQNNALVLLDHPFVDNDKTKTTGHISNELEQTLESLCKEYSGQITLEWNAYYKPWMRYLLKHTLNLIEHKTQYSDINKKAQELSKKLKKQGYNVPVLANTDLHARNSKLLQAIGTSRIITDLDGETPSEILQSMKSNIFRGNYKNIQKNISFMHLMRAFCFPILFPSIFNKPRS